MGVILICIGLMSYGIESTFYAEDTKGERYSLSLEGEVVSEGVTYDVLQKHLEKYPDHNYFVYSDSIGEWKPWKEVVDLKKGESEK